MDVLNCKKLIRSKSGLRIVTTNEEFRSPFVVQEPTWVPDKETSHCTHCMVKFGFTTRKHHCRRCGRIFCGSCCHTKMALQRMCFIDPVRICLKCEPQTRAENLFFEKHLKLLMNGAVFKYGDNNLGTTNYQLLHCKLSPDHRYLVFDGVKIAPVDLNQIISLVVKNDASTGTKSLILDYEVGDEKKLLRLDVAYKQQVEKTCINWLSAIEEAFRLISLPGKPEKDCD